MATSIITKTVNPMILVDKASESQSTTANTMKYMGVRVDIPSGYYFALLAHLSWTSTSPVAVCFSSASAYNPDTYIDRRLAYAEGQSCSICGYYPSARTLYVWGKWSGDSTTNQVYVRGWLQKA